MVDMRPYPLALMKQCPASIIVTSNNTSHMKIQGTHNNAHKVIDLK